MLTDTGLIGPRCFDSVTLSESRSSICPSTRFSLHLKRGRTRRGFVPCICSDKRPVNEASHQPGKPSRPLKKQTCKWSSFLPYCRWCLLLSARSKKTAMSCVPRSELIWSGEAEPRVLEAALAGSIARPSRIQSRF